ncbi:hypothetical protein ACERJO_08665 [Halalkalibacter sp. AB-rgal2]|uniref:hypothetical protein n=1 Tax=Halalkalibacter sp. AB-rgal2 TaxID=3242695 RepID=UPI00359E13FE
MNPMKGLFGLLVVSVLINIYLVVNINQLSNEVEHLIGLHFNNERNMENRLSSIDRELLELNEQNQWVTNMRFRPEVEESSSEEIVLQSEWTFREIGEDAHVTMMYRKENSSNWNEAEATLEAGTIYSSELRLNPNESYVYQIVSEGGMNRTTNEERIPEHVYQRQSLQLSKSTSRGRANTPMLFSATIHESEALFPFYEIESATATFRLEDGSEIIEPFLKNPNESEMNSQNESSRYTSTSVTSSSSLQTDTAIDEGVVEEANIWYVQLQEVGIGSVEIEVTYVDGYKLSETYHK